MKAMMMYHANGKGTGSAMRLELRPAHGETEGSVHVTLAPQKNDVGGFADFDWGVSSAVHARLDILDLTQILMVLRGIQESIADGKGLFHRTLGANKVIKFEHRIEPAPGYWLELSEKPTDGELRRVGFYLRLAEAHALCMVLEQSLLYVAFGIPALEA